MIINNLIKGRLLKRYKRFLSDVEIEDPDNRDKKIVIIAHCPNSGSMKSLIDGTPTCYISESDNPKRKLKYTLEILELPNNAGHALVNTIMPNKIVYEGIKTKKIKILKDYEVLQTEKKYGKESSRIDILVTDNNNIKNYVEVKNVTLAEVDLPSVAQFPDSVTSRGQKHLRELSFITNHKNEDATSNQGYIFYLVNRTDCNSFKVAEHIDKKYEEELIKAKKEGIKVLIYNTKIEIKKHADNSNNYSALIEVDKKLKYYK